MKKRVWSIIVRWGAVRARIWEGYAGKVALKIGKWNEGKRERSRRVAIPMCIMHERKA